MLSDKRQPWSISQTDATQWHEVGRLPPQNLLEIICSHEMFNPPVPEKDNCLLKGFSFSSRVLPWQWPKQLTSERIFLLCIWTVPCFYFEICCPCLFPDQCHDHSGSNAAVCITKHRVRKANSDQKLQHVYLMDIQGKGFTQKQGPQNKELIGHHIMVRHIGYKVLNTEDVLSIAHCFWQFWGRFQN